tara:strand:- start:11196 stop:12644 length:1449 start_codon:yes stop_codon:yes gene_type:complete
MPKKTIDLVKDVIKPFQKQVDFLKTAFTKPFVLYGGAMGGGKSYILRWFAVIFCLAWAKKGIHNVEVGLFCETYPALKDRHLDKARAEFPKWLGHWRDTDFILNGSQGIVKFRNLDNVEKYQSAEFGAILVDELTKNTLETFEILRTRLRWPGVTHTPFVGGTNPGGIGHTWVKKCFLDHNPPEYLLRSADNPSGYDVEDFAFIPSLPKDNPYLTRNYFDSLASMPEQMKQAYLHGDWSVFAGMFFPMFKRTRHGVEPFKVPDYWPVAASLDPGRNNCALGMYTKSPEGVVFKLGSYLGHNLSGPDHLSNIVSFIKDDLREWTDGRIPYVVTAGRDAWAKKERLAIISNDATWVELFMEAGLPLTPAVTDRVPGWINYKDALDHDRLKYFDNGLNVPTYEEMEGILSDDHVPEDLQGRGKDPNVKAHTLDETRYMLMTLYSPAEPDNTMHWRRPDDYRPKEPRGLPSAPTQQYSGSKDWRVA